MGLLLFLNAKFETFVDADMSSELLLSRILAKENRILTPNWYYSTELRVLNTQLFYAFFFKLTSNWHLVRILSWISMYLMLIMVYGLLCKAMKCEKYFACTAVFLIIPFSLGYFRYVLAGAYYIPHIAITFASLALTEKYLDSDEKSARIFLGANFVLAVIAGMGGPRQLMILYMPLAIVALVNWYEHREQQNALRKLAGILFVVMGGAIGYKINTGYLAKRYSFQQWNSMKFVKLSFDRLARIINGFFIACGYQTGEMFSKKVLITNCVCALWLIVTIGLVYYAIRYKEKVTEKYFRMAVFHAAVLVIYVLLYLFTNMSYKDRYNLPIVILTAPLIASAAENFELESWKKNSLLGIFVLLVCASGMIFYCGQGKKDETRELRAIQKQMVNQGYMEGYASPWKSNVVVELSNGEMEMWTWASHNDVIESAESMSEWLQPVSHSTEHPKGKCFLLMKNSEVEACPWPVKPTEDHIIYHSDAYTVYGYESYDELAQELDL